MKTLHIGLFLIVMAAKLIGQNIEMKKGLAVGDKVPDVLLKSVFNYKKDKEQLYNFNKGQLLLIDFFGTWCGSCVTAFPKMEKLQKKFNDKISVLPVTSESRQILANFAKKNHIVRASQFPFVTDDTLLSSFFNHEFVPHVVWIDSKGIVQAITSDLQVTEENIKKFFANDARGITQKMDLVGYDFRMFLPTGDSNFMFRSAFTKKIAAAGAYYTGAPPGRALNIKRLTAVNQSILNLYKLAFNNGASHSTSKNRLLLSVKDSTDYLPPENFPTTKYNNLGDWTEQNTYCYELILPEYFTNEQFYAAMMDDLNRYLKSKAKIVKRKIPCWTIIVEDSGYIRFTTKGNIEKYTFNNAYLEKLENVPIEALVKLLNRYKIDLPPIINATGFYGNVDMEFSNLSVLGSALDINCLRENLKKYGLNIRMQNWEADVLEITD